jgi:hypothetical protein
MGKRREGAGERREREKRYERSARGKPVVT